jgi:flagellar hook assembly protein FlgD
MGGKEYDEIWDGKNDQGNMVANGTYFFKLEAQGQTEWGKIVVIK